MVGGCTINIAPYQKYKYKTYLTYFIKLKADFHQNIQNHSNFKLFKKLLNF